MNAKRSSAECIVCGGGTYELSDPLLVCRYDVCHVCGFTYKQPRFHPSPEQERASYDQHENTLEHQGYVDMLESFLDEAVEPFVRGGKALDFGSGPGPVLYELLRLRGYEARHYDPFYRADETVFEETYDVITATEVFEHMSHPRREIARLYRILNRGGHLSIMTSLRPEKDGDFLSWWYRRDETHIAFFTERSLDVLIRDAYLTWAYSDKAKIFTFRRF